MSQSFPVEQGVRQGCPLSMILYIILAEVTIVNIKKTPKTSKASKSNKKKKRYQHLLMTQLFT